MLQHFTWTSSIFEIPSNLLKLVPHRFRNNHTLAQALHDHRWTHDVTGTLNEQTIEEMDLLWNRVQEVELHDHMEDNYIWKWTSNGLYTTQTAYSVLHSDNTTLHDVNLIWKTWASLKVKLFLWISVLGRQWLADRRLRHDV